MTDQNHKLDNPNSFDGITIDVNAPIESTDNNPYDPPLDTKESINERVGTTAEEMEDKLNYHVIRQIYSNIYEEHRYKHGHELQVPPICNNGYIMYEKKQCEVVFRYLTEILSIEKCHTYLNEVESDFGHIIQGEVRIKERIREKFFAILMGTLDLSSLQPDDLTIYTHPNSLDNTIRKSVVRPGDDERAIIDKIWLVRALISRGVDSLPSANTSRIEHKYRESLITQMSTELSRDKEFIKRVMDEVEGKLETDNNAELTE